MAQSFKERQGHQSALEEIHNTLVAASNKMAQLQLDAMDETHTADALADAINDLSPVIEAISSLSESHRMETNRLSNEGALED